MAPEAEVLIQPGRPRKGVQDISWPICPNCQGNGTITQEVAIALASAGKPGSKGDPCETCNAVGRVPDRSWPPCPECDPARPDPLCQVCVGLGLLSPERATMLAKGKVLVTCKGCNGAGAVAYRPYRPGKSAAAAADES